MNARLGLVALSVVVTTAACGGSSNPAAPTATVGTATTITTANGPGGAHLTDSAGNSLYLFTSDTGSTSTCSGACATGWPPLTKNVVKATALAHTALLGRTDREDGTVQITYAGHPLYLYAGDTSPGSMNGAGSTAFGGHWYLVGPTGKALGASAASPEPEKSDDDSGYYSSY